MFGSQWMGQGLWQRYQVLLSFPSSQYIHELVQNQHCLFQHLPFHSAIGGLFLSKTLILFWKFILKKEDIQWHGRKRYKCICYDRLKHKATSNDYEDQYKPKNSQIVILNNSWKIKPDNDLWVKMQVAQRRIVYIGMRRIQVQG